MPASVIRQRRVFVCHGSMVLTREDHWKEIKSGRVFSEKQCLQTEGKTNSIKASQYLSHLGDSKTFTQKTDAVSDEYGKLNERLIFITDGAAWLRNPG